MEKIIAGIMLVCMTVLGNATPQLTIRKNEQVPNQNIALGIPNQLFGSYLAVVTGGAILSPSQIFYIGTESGGGVTNVSNFVLVNKEGTVIAGPVDHKYLFEGPPLGEVGSITFTDVIALPEGTNALFLKGNVETSFQVNVQMVTGTAPSLWTVTDLNGTPLPQSASATGLIIGQTMTVRGPSLTVSFTSGEQTVIAGSQQVSFGSYVFDATQSSEDIRVSVIPGDYRFNEATSATDLTNIRLYGDTTSVTTGYNVLNPTRFGAQTFTLDGNGFIVPKGTIKTIQVRVDVRSNITGTYQWRVQENQAWSFIITGMASAQSAAITLQPTGPFILHVIQHGEVAITKVYTPSISEKGDGTDTFFAFSVATTGEPFQGGIVSFRVQADPSTRFQIGNGLIHPKLTSGGTSLESVLIPWQVDAAVTSYHVSFNLMQAWEFPKNTEREFRFILEYDNGLQTGDEVSIVFDDDRENIFTGVTSGARVKATLPP
ncbi:MAG: hypothetical protein EXS46_00840 [Candidatus Taylorbacteria bacterium]|nr:hypothetical protein [Candidatus Taylorbacteria bacterium]